MCEMLAASFPEARPFAELSSMVAGLEEYGLGGFGWGIAWLEAGRVRGVRGLGRFRAEGLEEDILRIESTRFLVHLRRPSQLSTIQMADTQPFFDGEESAWCHNGFLERAEQLRADFPGKLHGRADSEVGWQYFLARRAEGHDTSQAFREVDETFGGKVNLGFLGSDGELAVYAQNLTNKMWRFVSDGGVFAATALHSDDSSVFDLVIPKASEQELIEQATSFRLSTAD